MLGLGAPDPVCVCVCDNYEMTICYTMSYTVQALVWSNMTSFIFFHMKTCMVNDQENMERQTAGIDLQKNVLMYRCKLIEKNKWS